MELISKYLESSTIHGLFHISTSRKFDRVLWIFIVVSGFICSGVMINKAFESRSVSPISTTIETLPINKVKLPKITGEWVTEHWQMPISQ